MSLEQKIDRFIGLFSPKRAYERQAFRRAAELMSSYKGASTGRLKSSWAPGGGSADADILPDLPTLRERNRDLVRNDAHAAGIMATLVTNIVGTGIELQSRLPYAALGIKFEKASELQAGIEGVFEDWGCYADGAEKMHFWEIQRLVCRQIFENGEIILQPVMLNDPARPYAFALDLIESDRMATPPDKRSNKNIRDGVEIGDRGQPIAYYIRKTHPGDNLTFRTTSEDYVRIPAKNEYGYPNIFHFFVTDRPGQSRGVPLLAPVLSTFKDLGEYMEAELVAARVAACFAIFIKQNDPVAGSVYRANRTDGAGKRIESLEPGMIEHLGPGQDITAFNPNRPGGSFDPFVQRMLHTLAGGVNLPYLVMTKDFGRANYSSARSALLEARRVYSFWQKFIAQRLCRPVLARVLEEAHLRSLIDIGDFYEKRDLYCRARWIPQGHQWVDPMKEAQASDLSVRRGLSTLSDECAAQGKDWEDVLEQRAREEKKIKDLEDKFGIRITESVSTEKPQPGDNPTEEEEENEEDQ